MLQPPSGGCVLKLLKQYAFIRSFAQPPSGGCVLKQGYQVAGIGNERPAAFGRLCVETAAPSWLAVAGSPAAFGRLCVET